MCRQMGRFQDPRTSVVCWEAGGRGVTWGGAGWVGNSIRQQNKTPLTQPNAKGVFESRSLLTQCSCSLICSFCFLAVLQPSLGAPRQHFFNTVFGLLFGFFILDYIPHCP